MVKYTIGDALKAGIALLNENLKDDCTTDAMVIMCRILNCDKLRLTIDRECVLKDEDEKMFFSLIKRRSLGEPLSYILNHREFMSLDFYVDENVLIPRPDTEVLVERVISHFEDKKADIIDMCTGSGAIAVSLAKYLPLSTVTGLDISEPALKIAVKNAESNGVCERCTFLFHDALLPYEKKADAIVSNPPYIPTADVEKLDITVKDFEPRLALDGGYDGLKFYQAITQNSKYSLNTGGVLAFEVGCGLSESVASLMEKDFKNIEIIDDLAGIARVVFGIKK